MTKKIFRSIILVALAVLIAGFAIIMTSLYQYFTTQQKDQLENQLQFAVQGVEQSGQSYLQSLTSNEYRLTWIAADGTVLFDSQAESAQMENHADRQEVKEALAQGKGSSTRYSKTLTQRTQYMAQRLSDGTVLRISADHLSVFTLLMGMLQPLFVVALIAVILSVALAVRLSKSIVKPLSELSFDHPLDNEVYEELSPMLRHMDEQNKQIKAQMKELKQKRHEFATITENMSEGLVLLNAKGRIISINAAAKQLFSTDEDCLDRDFITVDRTPEISECIAAVEKTSFVETYIPRNGRDYLFRFSRIESKAKQLGIVILVIDVTEKLQAERTRREFTANVSHELKSPLHSIIGSAELIETGLAKPEDVPRFIGHIKTEATRLVTLVNDIIRLSQLDENVAMSQEPVDVYEVACEVAETLCPLAAKKGIAFEVEGESVLQHSVKPLLQEIIYNLCDNAIQYNREQGRVTLRVTPMSGGVQIAVADTGIGIAPEYQDRVFERFFRVDKSHSKETGGTGLGLSIVKHAVRYLGGQIGVESRLNEGTTIIVTLPDRA